MKLEDYHKYMDRIGEKAGRYPEGYRQYENYASYSFINPDATQADY